MPYYEEPRSVSSPTHHVLSSESELFVRTRPSLLSLSPCLHFSSFFVKKKRQTDIVPQCFENHSSSESDFHERTSESDKPAMIITQIISEGALNMGVSRKLLKEDSHIDRTVSEAKSKIVWHREGAWRRRLDFLAVQEWV